MATGVAKALVEPGPTEHMGRDEGHHHLGAGDAVCRRRVLPVGVCRGWRAGAPVAGAERARVAGVTNVSFATMDAEDPRLAEAGFDAVTCRLGLMFLPHLDVALERLGGLLAPGGRLVAAVWGRAEANPWLTEARRTLVELLELPPPPPGSPDVFSLAGPRAAPAALAKAGFERIRCRRVAVRGWWSGPQAYAAFHRDGPMSRMVADESPDRQGEAWRQVAAVAARGQPTTVAPNPSRSRPERHPKAPAHPRAGDEQRGQRRRVVATRVRRARLAVGAAVVVVLSGVVAAVDDPGVAESQTVRTQLTIGAGLPVKASQDGTWTVGVSGTPNVQVANSEPIQVSGSVKVEPSLVPVKVTPTAAARAFNCTKRVWGVKNLLNPEPSTTEHPVGIVFENGTGCPLSDGRIIPDDQRVNISSLTLANLGSQQIVRVAAASECDTGTEPETAIGLLANAFEDVAVATAAPGTVTHLDFPEPIVVGPQAANWCLMATTGAEANVWITVVGHFS